MASAAPETAVDGGAQVQKAEKAKFPPFPDIRKPPRMSVADTIKAGRTLREQDKSVRHDALIRPLPRPARAKFPKVTDVKQGRRASRAHALCLRRHGAVLTDRLEYMAKPARRTIIYLWRDHAYTLPPETIARLRAMLDADEPFKPDKAYEYFLNTRKTKKGTKKVRFKQIKQNIKSLCAHERYVWARNATIQFARGVQQRLRRPGQFALADGMLRLSNIILDELCGYMRMRTPCRCSRHPKSKFMMEMSDKVAVWIDEILSECDDRMLMMDFDEDQDVYGYTDEFLNSMRGDGPGGGGRPGGGPGGGPGDGADGGPGGGSVDKGPAVTALIKELKAHPDDELYEKDKAKRNNAQAAEELDEAISLESKFDDPALTDEITANFEKIMQNATPPELHSEMPKTLETCAKYLSQKAVEEIDRGPVFELLVKTMEKQGWHKFKEDFQPLSNQFAAAHTLRTAPGFSSVVPNQSTVPIYAELLHKAVDSQTPKNFTADMNGVIRRCANYLSGFARDRDKAMQAVITAMKGGGDESFSTRKDYTMTFATAVTETETSPLVVPYHPVYEIAQENREKLTKRVTTPTELKIAVKTAVSDVADHLSQAIALRSGVAGERYGIDLVRKMMNSMGNKPLFKNDAYGMSYADGAEEAKDMNKADLANANPLCENLQETIAGEIKTTVPTTVAQPIFASMLGDIEDVAKYLGKVGFEKSGDVNNLVSAMHGKDDQLLSSHQGYDQTHGDGARRIENADSLKADKVDQAALGGIQDKLNALGKNGMTDDAAKYLATPLPETDADKQRLLADLMARKGTDELARDGMYKMNYTEGGKEIMNANPAVHTSSDNAKKEQIERFIGNTIPNDKLKEHLKDTASSGAAHLTDVVKGRGDAMKFIEGQVRGLGNTDFLTMGKFKKTYKGAADMIATASSFDVPKPNALILELVHKQIVNGVGSARLPEANAAKNMPESINIASKYISKKVEDQCGMDAKAIADFYSAYRGETPEGRGAGKKVKTSRLVGPDAYDPEHKNALEILHKALIAKGGEIFYKQPHTELTYKLASDWVKMSPPMEVNKSVKGSSDTARLHKKFEKKLSELVTPTTPDNLKDAMQDIVIESSRILSENFVSRNYKALVKDAMIAELQKRGGAIVIDRNGLTENAFFVAQRLKQTDSIDPVEPVQANISSIVAKNLEDIIRCHSMARKLSGTMKDHIKSVADYLSAFVTKPDEKIEAYVAMLEEMDKLDKELLIEESITKSFKDAAAYLRTLISNVDQINLSNASLKSTIVSKITNVMSQSGRDKNYAPAVLSGVIENSAQMLVSYVMLQGEKTEALQFLILQMDVMPDALLLRHGEIRKSNGDGANLLRGKNTDQLAVTNVDPVVARKIQIKVNTLMPTTIPDKFQRIMNEVISDATKYLAVHLLLPEVVKVCKCMKNVFVQCELWCEEIVRRVSQPCCTCSRQVSAKALSNLVLDERVRAAISGPGASAGPHIDIEIRPCPAAQSRSRHEPHGVCPGSNPTSGCRTKASYMLYSTEYNHQRQYVEGPTRLPRPAADSYNSDARLRGPTSECPSDHLSDLFGGSPAGSSPSEDGCHVSSRTSGMSYYTPTNKMLDESQSTESSMSPSTTMHAQIWPEYSRFAPSMKEVGPGVPKYTIGKEAYRNRAPIVATDQKEDWQAMMVSLMWNVQGWRNWIQETIDRALVSRSSSDDVTGHVIYPSLCQIVSPTRASLKTGLYMQCQNEMLDIINMFNRWTHWLSVIIKDSDTMQCPSSADGDTRWSYFKNKVEEYADDWIKYNMHLKVCWEHKYTTVMKDWVPTWSEPRPVWVMSTGGAVPSGAVAAGAADGELTWVARITHDALVLPAALQPSKQCCVLYADGAIHHYNKYQVLCNAEVLWMPWRASWMSARAVRVAPAVYIGRVLYRGAHLVGAVLAPNYRCHVIIFGRPFAFNCYELLVLAELY